MNSESSESRNVELSRKSHPECFPLPIRCKECGICRSAENKHVVLQFTCTAGKSKKSRMPPMVYDHEHVFMLPFLTKSFPRILLGLRFSKSAKNQRRSEHDRNKAGCFNSCQLSRTGSVFVPLESRDTGEP